MKDTDLEIKIKLDFFKKWEKITMPLKRTSSSWNYIKSRQNDLKELCLSK
jgi:hypothetical protein